MTPEEIAAALGGHGNGDEVLASIDASAGPAVAHAIRHGFEEGDEQGNGRRLEALFRIEGEACLDVIRAVLEDAVEVGGIYSNLRNLALELVRDNFLGHPALKESLWRAIEIDEYLYIDALYPVVAAYDKARALALLEPQIEAGVPAAITLLAKDPAARPKLLEIADKALAGDDPGSFIELLGEVAREPDLAAKIAPLAVTVPAAAEIGMVGDEARIRAVADKLASPDARWGAAAVRALRMLAPEEAFERAAPVFTASDRGKPVGRARIEAIVWSLGFADPRWYPLLVKRLADEADGKVRALVVTALGKFGAQAVDLVINAARDDKDKDVLAAIPDALAEIGPDHGVLEQVREAAGKAKGKRKKALEAALEMLDA